MKAGVDPSPAGFGFRSAQIIEETLMYHLYLGYNCLGEVLRDAGFLFRF